MKERKPIMTWNSAEEAFLKKSGRKETYPGEYLPLIETGNVCELGKLTALSFLLWVNDHPDGVIALPTGKTPELFIEYLKFYKQNWNTFEVQEHLRSYGIHLEKFPETKQLKFVQLDEFYPIDVEQKNSFTSYIKNYYLNLLEIPAENVLEMDLCSIGLLKEKGHETIFPEGKVDLTLMERAPKTEEERWQQQALQEAEVFCRQYENRIRLWGGIGFFLGGIGPDGHIAFNMEGGADNSKTRLVQLNYPSAASAACDLGGIEYSRNKTAITIGLETITFNKDAVVIIMAAGEAKAPVIARAVCGEKHPNIPATAFYGCKGARFYVTQGAASQLYDRRIEDVQRKACDGLHQEEIDDVVIELALKAEKRILDLNHTDFASCERGGVLIEKITGDLSDLLIKVHGRLAEKINQSLDFPKGTTILHTGPHHDDIMLSYHSLMCQLLPQNQNYYAYLTSGFNSVTNSYMIKTLNAIPEENFEKNSVGIFEKDYDSLLKGHILAAENHKIQEMEEIEGLILLKKVAAIFSAQDASTLRKRVQWLKETYFPNRHPGEKDIPEVQILKGGMRESESERMLLRAGVTLPQIYHLRTKFYTGDHFDPMPTIEKDTKPFMDLCYELQPGIITVAFDPEGTGPDTHYKVLQVVAQGLRMGGIDSSLKVWGYRNVWHRFSLFKANLIVPSSEKELEQMNQVFLNYFSTQKEASFPAPNYDGPFSGLAEKIQREQYEQLKILLGGNFFSDHSNPLIRNARGFVFIQEMNQKEFIESARELKSRIELM